MINLLWILMTVVASGASFVFFLSRARDGIPASMSWVIAGVPAVSVAVFLQALRVSSVFFGKYLRRMLAPGTSRPRDGERVALAGRIEPVHPGEVLESPFTRQPCVAYDYVVGNLGSGVDVTPLAYGDDSLQRIGFALTPSVVRGGGIEARLLAWPDLHGFWPQRYALLPRDRSQIAQNAASYFTATPTEEVSILDFRGPFRTAMEAITRDDGRIKKDIRLRGFRVFPKPITYAEWIVRPGEEITLVGT